MQETDSEREARLRGLASGSFSLSPRRAHDFLYTGRPMYRIPFGTMTSRSTRWKRSSRPGNFEGRTAADESRYLAAACFGGRAAASELNDPSPLPPHASPPVLPDLLLLLWLLLGDANGRCFFNSLVHFLGGQQRSDGYARVSSHIGAQLRGCCRDFVGIADN